jgi:predicted AAA+ superfamily ATPase
MGRHSGDPVEGIHWNISNQSHESADDILNLPSARRCVRRDHPRPFFAKTYPTRGMKELLKAICLRLSGCGGEMSSIIRLGTQYGGGKTHSLIALVHAIRGMKGVSTPENFVDPAILPSGAVRIAALDGENADPANGLTLEPGLLARSLWGEMAYRLAGRAGHERVRISDERHIAPGRFASAPSRLPRTAALLATSRRQHVQQRLECGQQGRHRKKTMERRQLEIRSQKCEHQ